MQVAAVILAAGSSTRFGSPKQQVRIAGRTMLEMVAATAVESGLSPIIAVVPPGSVAPAGVTAVENDRPADGLSRSLRLGLEAVPRHADGAVVLLGDEPFIEADAVLAVVVAGATGASVVAARAGERLGPPVYLPRGRFGLAVDAEGDRGLGPMLRAAPDLAAVDLDHPPIDVDTPADLDAVAPACPGCGARVPAPAGTPTHGYLGASPGCWTTFGEVLAREFGDVAYGRMHRHTVDVYAAQHPGTDDRRQRASVALHLIALCRWLEHGDAMPKLNVDTQRLASESRDWPWLAPPTSYSMTVLDVLAAADGIEHGRLVRRWAKVTWEAWSEHHDAVRRWAADV